jgi:hypothetical protein
MARRCIWPGLGVIPRLLWLLAGTSLEQLNCFVNVVVVNKAVSSPAGVSCFYLTALDNGGRSIYHDPLPQSGIQMVETTCLDVFLESDGWPSVGLLRLVVEEAESDVFAPFSYTTGNPSQKWQRDGREKSTSFPLAVSPQGI